MKNQKAPSAKESEREKIIRKLVNIQFPNYVTIQVSYSRNLQE